MDTLPWLANAMSPEPMSPPAPPPPTPTPQDASNADISIGDEAIRGALGTDTGQGFESTNEQSRRELARRHAQLKARKQDQMERARELARELPGSASLTQRSVPPSVLAHAPSTVSSPHAAKCASMPNHQHWGVLTVCNRKRPPLLTEPAFILEAAFDTVHEAREYMDRAVRTPGYVGAPMAIRMREYEILAVSRERQVDAALKSRKTERLLGRFYLDMEVRQREHTQNVMQRKAGRVGLSRNFMEMRQRSERDTLKQEAVRRRIKRQARRKRKLLHSARKQAGGDACSALARDEQPNERATDAQSSDDKKDTHASVVDPIHSVPAFVTSKFSARRARTTREREEGHDDNDDDNDGDDKAEEVEGNVVDELELMDHEETERRLKELRGLGGRHNIQYTFPSQLKLDHQAFALISILEDTDQMKDDCDADANGNEPLLMWFGCFPDEATAKACAPVVMAEYPDVGAVDVVPMHVPLRPNNIELDDVEEHYKDPEQEAICAFRKSQKHAHAKFEELCGGVDLPFVDLTVIDLSPMEHEAMWRKRCEEARQQELREPELPRAVVDYYASVFKNNGAVPIDVKHALLEGRVERPIVQIMNEEYEAAKKKADQSWEARLAQ